jgi:arylsulfatase A-like enzyme
VAYTVTQGGRAATIRTDRWRYTRWSEEAEAGMEELYDHWNDPEEFKNLAGHADFEKILIQMREKFEDVRNEARNGLLLTKN